MNELLKKSKSLLDQIDDVKNKLDEANKQLNKAREELSISEFNFSKFSPVFSKSKEICFQEAAKPLMDYLKQNYHPHMTVIVTAENSEMVGGLMSYTRPELLLNKPL